jgi:tetratricopeptide (TPR) repeat protein
VETERVYQFDKAIPEFVKSLEIYNKWNSKPLIVDCYTELGKVYHKTGRYKEEKKLHKQAEKDFIDDTTIMWNQAILSLVERDTVSANRYFKKLITGWKDNSTSEAAISTNLAIIYWEAGITDQAEIYLRKALALEPENRRMQSILAYFLIDKDSNNNEGLELINKALVLSPDNYEYLDTKGWGLYKQGKFKEALEILQKSWDLRRQKAIYDHEAFLHLEAAKKAVASQKKN